MTTAATQDTSLQALLTVSHSLSLANDCPNIFLSLLKDNATSRNPALPSGQKQCNVLHSSPASGFLFIFSFLLYFSRQNQFIFLRPCTNSNHSNSQHNCTQQNLTYQSLCNTCNPAFQSKSSLNLCNTCNPVQSEMSIHHEFLNTSNRFTSPH